LPSKGTKIMSGRLRLCFDDDDDDEVFDHSFVDNDDNDADDSLTVVDENDDDDEECISLASSTLSMTCDPYIVPEVLSDP